MKNKITRFICLLLCAVLLTGCCSHDWEEADCEQPRTCVECGKEEGEKGDHDWEKATCEQPKTCSVCGKEKGGLGDHKWKEATCTEPEQCRYCGDTQGQPAGHRWVGTSCQECGEARPAADAPAADAPAADPMEDDGSLGITPDLFLSQLMSYACMFSEDYTLGDVQEDSAQWYIRFIDYGGKPVFKLIMILDQETGNIDDLTLQQLEENIPEPDLISVYPIAIAMGRSDPAELSEFYRNLSTYMTSQDIRENAVYEIYEMEGYYIQVLREETDEGKLYEVEVFRPTVF